MTLLRLLETDPAQEELDRKEAERFAKRRHEELLAAYRHEYAGDLARAKRYETELAHFDEKCELWSPEERIAAQSHREYLIAGAAKARRRAENVRNSYPEAFR